MLRSVISFSKATTHYWLNVFSSASSKVGVFVRIPCEKYSTQNDLKTKVVDYTEDHTEVQKVDFRMALHSLVNNNNTVQDEQNKFGFRDFSPKINAVSVSAQPCVLISYGNISYCINPSAGFMHQFFNLGKMPLLNTVLFTKCDDKSALDLLPSLLNSKQMHSNHLNVFGPSGTQDVFRRLMPFFSSVKACERVKSSLLFHETQKAGIVTVKKSPATVSFVNYYSKELRRHTTAYYILESEILNSFSNFGTRKKLSKSWNNFSTVQSYMKYVTNHSKRMKTKQDNDKMSLQICVLDCPNRKCLDEQMNNIPALLQKFSKSSLCVHLTPKSLYYSTDYVNFCHKLSGWKHVSAHELIDSNKFSDKCQYFRGLLHILHPYFFPLYSNKTPLESFQKEIMHASTIKKHVCLELKGESFKWTNNFLHKNDCRMTLFQYLSDLPTLPLMKRFCRQACYPSFVILGSGSSLFSPSRSQPSYLLRIDPCHAVLLDCSPDTPFQIVNHYGYNLAQEILASLQAVVLTHKHSDHWCGILNLLVHLRGKRRERLFVFLPDSTKSFFLLRCDDDILKLINLVALEEFYENSIEFHQLVAKSLNVESLDFVQVDHGPPTFGVVIKLLCGKKIVYSTDTLPCCKALIKVGRDADLLIHDCLYVDEVDKTMANIRMHSTMQGAISTAKQMRAKNLMLTHFAVKFSYLPVDVSSIEELFDGNLMIALDHLELPLSEMKNYVEFLKILPLVFLSKNKSSAVYKLSKIDELSSLFEKVKIIKLEE